MMHVTACTLLALLAATGSDITTAIKKDRAALQGTWKVSASTSNGAQVAPEELKDLFIIFRGDAILIREGGQTSEKFTYLLDPLKKPCEIDLIFRTDANKGRQDRGIYLLEGDKLKICIQANKDVARPRSFTSTPDSQLWLVIMERTKN